MQPIPTLQQLQLFASERNISAVQAEQWMNMMNARHWRMNNGEEIRDWRRAFVGFFKYGFRLSMPVKEEETTTTTQTTTTVRREWQDPMLTLPHLIELDRQRQADYEQYLREKNTPEYKAARQKALSRFGLTD